MRIGVIGAGHAGVEAAKSAVKTGASVVLFSAEPVYPYFRPRLVALALGQASEEQILLNPSDWYGAHGIDLRLNAGIEEIDPAAPAVITGAGREAFDALVLATGAGPVVPAFARGAPGCLVPLWNIGHALELRKRAVVGARLVIIGGGVIGIEAALRALDAGLSVVIVEKMPRLMQSNLGPRAGAAVRTRLEKKGVMVLTGETVTGMGRGSPHLCVTLASGRTVEADVGIVSIGFTRDTALARKAGLTVNKGIVVDSRMLTSAPKVLACGDAAETGGDDRCSVPHALAQGRTAGENACAVAAGKEPRPWTPVHPPMVLKYGDTELRAIGHAPASEAEEVLLEGCDDFTVRALTARGGVTVGVQMVGDCSGFDEYARKVTG